MMRKTMVSLLIVLVLMISMVSVFAAGQVEGAEGKTTIRVIQYAGGGTEFWKAIDKSFMEEYPNIVVEQEIVQPGQYHQKLGGYVTTGKGPDIALMEAGTSTFMYRNVLTDLKGKFDDILPNITGLGIYYDDFDPAKPLLAIPTATNGHMVYYNKQIFKEAGLNPEKPPKTWAEMDAAVKAIRAIGKEPIALGGREYGVYWLVSAITHQVMSAQEQADMFNKTQKWTQGKNLNVIKAMNEIYKRGWICDDAASMTVTPAAQDMFVNGDAGFFVSLIGDAFNWKVWGDSMGYENVGAMLFPELRAGDIPGVQPSPLADTLPLWGSYAFGIMKWSNNVDAAVTYMKYLLRPDVQKRFVLEGGFFPNNVNELDPSFVSQPVFATLFEWVKDSEAIPGIFYWQAPEWDAFVRNTQLLYSDMTTVNDFAADMQRIREGK
jgi:ABC-type glycerol-3-phosphate transport system substrate-binding protein